MKSSFAKAAIGSQETGQHIAARVARTVPAYAAFLREKGADPAAPFSSLPLTDKKTYILAHPFRELLADDYETTFTVFRSSGSSGHGCFWPQLRAGSDGTVAALRAFLEESFRIHERKTLAVVGLALGSWIGGEHISWALKSLALAYPRPFAVFSPGNHHREIIRMLRNAGGFVDQFILFVCPSAVAHLHLLAEQSGEELPLDRMRYVVLGEPFPESVREHLRRRADVRPPEPVMLSIYGSADTGTLGVESPASAALRGLFASNDDLRASLGIPRPLPHLFHAAAPDALLETAGEELCVTRWQGIPLVRYNLHDRAFLCSWPGLLREAAASPAIGANEAAVVHRMLEATPALSDILAVSGRADSCLVLCGTNLTEAMLDEAVRAPELAGLLTGAYRAGIEYLGERQALGMRVELTRGTPVSDEVRDRVYAGLIRAIGRVQPEFEEDWRNIYRAWDGAPDRRIIRLRLEPWPELSGGEPGRIKHRGVETA